MKTYKILGILTCVLALAAVARAADEAKTINGEAKCAKTDMKSQDKCQTVIQAKEGDKTVSYYVAANDVSNAFHVQICGAPKPVTATGTIKTVDGKQELTVTKIEVKK